MITRANFDRWVSVGAKMDAAKTFFLELPKEKSIDIEFENIEYSVPNGRRGNF